MLGKCEISSLKYMSLEMIRYLVKITKTTTKTISPTVTKKKV